MPAPETLRDLRRGQVVAAARRLVAEEGLEALTIGALEERLAFSRGVITYHFRNKDEIVEAVLQSAIDEIEAAMLAEVAQSATPAEKVGAVVRSMVHGFLDRPEAARILVSFWSRLHVDRRVRRLNARLYETYRHQSARLVEHGREAGAFADVPADALGAVLVGLVIGIVTQAYFDPGAVDVDAAVAEAARTLLARLAPASAGRRRPRPRNPHPFPARSRRSPRSR